MKMKISGGAGISWLALGVCVACSNGASLAAPLARQAAVEDVAQRALGGPALHAMHIGADAYLRDPLRGAVNDAKALSALSRDLGAVTNLLLLDADANRQAILDGWAQLLRASGPGDVLLVTYAGHGSYVSVQDKPEEPDNRDEILLLPGVDRGGKDQIIVDDEIAQMFAQASDRRVIWLADACHSGTSSRSAGNPDLAFPMRSRLRNGEALELPPISETDLKVMDQANVVSIAAVTDDTRVPEILHRGNMRGALSVAFERAVRGHADRAPADGMLSFDELRAEIVAQVRILTNNGQAPQLESGLAPSLPLMPSLALREEPLTKSRVFLANDQRLSDTDRAALLLATDLGMADFKWDVASGDVVRLTEGVGKRVAEGVTETGGMLGEILRWEVMQLLQQLPREDAPELRVRPANGTSGSCLDAGQECARGTRLRLEASLDPSSAHPYLTLLDLSAQGTVYWYDVGANRSTINALVQVGEPYGVEHVVAIATAEPLTLGVDTQEGSGSSDAAATATLRGARATAALEILRALAETGEARTATWSLHTTAR